MLNYIVLFVCAIRIQLYLHLLYLMLVWTIEVGEEFVIRGKGTVMWDLNMCIGFEG